MHLRLSTGIKRHIIYRLGEPEHGTVEPEILRYVHKLQETRDGKCQLVEEFNFKLLEARSGNPMNKCLQVSANTTELKKAKARKRDECGDTHMRMFPFYIAVGYGESKVNCERLQVGQE